MCWGRNARAYLRCGGATAESVPHERRQCQYARPVMSQLNQCSTREGSRASCGVTATREKAVPVRASCGARTTKKNASMHSHISGCPGAGFTKIYTNSYLHDILFHHDVCVGIKIYFYHIFCKGIYYSELKKLIVYH